jgi:phage shock protein A
MGIFSRLTDIINANINSLLERAEDPEKMIRLMIQEMEDTLVEVRSQAVRSIAEKKDLGRKLDALNAKQQQWDEKAEFALRKNREDLAKSALLVKRKLEEQAEMLTQERQLVEESLERHNADLTLLQAKLAEAKTRKKGLEVRMKTAQNRVKIKRTLHDGRVDDALNRYESLERRIDDLEANADVYDLGKKKTLVEEFADLEVEADIAADLERLKARVGGGQV